MKVLAGPWIGEFGWELFCWQAYLRSIKNILNIEDMVAVTRPGRELLYQDFCKVETVEIKGIADTERCPGVDLTGIINQLKSKYLDYQVLPPSQIRYYGKPVNMNVLGHNITVDPTFVRLGDPIKEDYPVIIHARNRKHRSGDNWSKENWQKVGDHLHKQGIKFACIGSLEESSLVTGAEDLRGLPLSDTTSYISGAKVTMGPSSGPMTLATLCKCPLLVWSGNSINKSRFRTEWNPFNSDITYLDSWQPKPESVLDNLDKILNRV